MGNNLNTNKLIFAAFLFILSYAIIFFLSASHPAIKSAVASIPVLNIALLLPTFESPMFYAMPIVGFFIMFALVGWVNKYFKTRQGSSVLLPILFIILALAAYLVALHWYYGNLAMLSSNNSVLTKPCFCYDADPNKCNTMFAEFNSQNNPAPDGRIERCYGISFWLKLQTSAYYLFLIGGLFGWLSRYVVEKIKL